MQQAREYDMRGCLHLPPALLNKVDEQQLTHGFLVLELHVPTFLDERKQLNPQIPTSRATTPESAASVQKALTATPSLNQLSNNPSSSRTANKHTS